MPRSGFERLSWGAMVAGGLVAALPATLAGLRQAPELLRGGLVNPDSAMRLVRLHDILAAGAPVHAVMRDGSGQGTMLHWSHLLDSVLLVLAAPLALVMGWDGALHAVALVFGPLSLAALGVAVMWAALPVAGRGWAWVGALGVGAAPVLGAYGMPGIVHHHVLLALGAVMTAGWAWRALRGDGVAAGVGLGAWAGAGLWLSPESVAFALMALGAPWAAWVAAPRRPAVALVAASVTFLLVTVSAWVVDPPAAGLWAVEPDRISLPFVLLALGAAVIAGLAHATRRRWLTVGVGAGVAGVWLLLFPQMHRGTAGLMAPEAAAAAFFDGILEMLPVDGAEGVLEDLLGGLFSVAVLGVLAWRRPGVVRVYALACAVGLLGLAAAHIRFAAYPAVAGAVVLPCVLAWISRSGWAPARQSTVRLAVLLPLLLTPMLAPLTARATPGGTHAVCSIEGAIPLLAGHAGAIVLAEVNDTPDLLYRTPVRTVGSLYHRNPAGFMRLRAAWRSVPGEGGGEGGGPSPAVVATGATLVLGCPGAARSSIVAGLPRETLLDRLLADSPPGWLRRIGDAGPGGFVLYAVVR